jgi:chromosomal replication initiation ATPase DnaA
MATKLTPHQLALSLDHDESFARADFIRGTSNAAALALVDGWPDWPGQGAVIIGPEGAGKSHLAAIWAERAGAHRIQARSLSGLDLPASLARGALVVEDMVSGDFDERALFHLLNFAREEKAYLLMTARTAPGTWDVAIPDLNSRLRSLPVTCVAAPDERLIRALMIKQAADRQFELDESVVNFLVVRIERSFSSVRSAIQRLDQAAMQQKRPVTRALAAELFRDEVA